MTNGVSDAIDLTRKAKNLAKAGIKKMYKIRVDESLDLQDARKALDDPIHDVYGKRPVSRPAPKIGTTLPFSSQWKNIIAESSSENRQEILASAHS